MSNSVPSWKQAVTNFMALKPYPGMEITKKWLATEFGLKKPITAEDQEKFSIDFMNNMVHFKDEILTQFLVCIASKNNGKYFVISPQDQTEHADYKHVKEIYKSLNNMKKKMRYVDHSKLTDAQRVENANALARTDDLRRAVRTRKKASLPFKGVEEEQKEEVHQSESE